MKIVWVKNQNDEKNFRLQENMGWEVRKIQDLEEVDQKLEELIQEKYDSVMNIKTIDELLTISKEK